MFFSHRLCPGAPPSPCDASAACRVVQDLGAGPRAGEPEAGGVRAREEGARGQGGRLHPAQGAAWGRKALPIIAKWIPDWLHIESESIGDGDDVLWF